MIWRGIACWANSQFRSVYSQSVRLLHQAPQSFSVGRQLMRRCKTARRGFVAQTSQGYLSFQSCLGFLRRLLGKMCQNVPFVRISCCYLDNRLLHKQRTHSARIFFAREIKISVVVCLLLRASWNMTHDMSNRQMVVSGSLYKRYTFTISLEIRNLIPKTIPLKTIPFCTLLLLVAHMFMLLTLQVYESNLLGIGQTWSNPFCIFLHLFAIFE